MEPSSYPLKSWQLTLLDNMTKYQGRGTLQVTGRGTGKSYMNQIIREWQEYMAVPYRCIAEAQVDGEQWYTVTAQKPICQWVRTQDEKYWHEHIDKTWHISYNTFDIHEKLYMMLGMKFNG